MIGIITINNKLVFVMKIILIFDSNFFNGKIKQCLPIKTRESLGLSIHPMNGFSVKTLVS